MPEFAYTARSLDGSDVVGLLQAPTERDAMTALVDQSLFPLTVSDTSQSVRFDISGFFKRRRRVSAELTAACLTQLADLLNNGVPLLGALKLLAEQSTHPVLGEILTDVHDRVAEGETLEDAMANHGRVFSELTISMVRAGSEGAFLEEALAHIAGFLELQEELRSRVKGAMAYPTFLMIGGFAVTMLLIIFFVPKFEGLFERLERQGTGLPLATIVLLSISDGVTKYGVFVFAAAAGVFAILRKLVLSERGQELSDKWKLKLPVFGKILHGTAISRFCRVLGTLLRNGVPILKALDISSGSVGNRQLAQAIRSSAENISSGETLSAPLAASKLIPPSIMAMIRIAEESNNLDTVLVNAANSLDKKIERQLDMMVRLIEPLMLVVIGVAVLFVLVALLLPVFEMSATV
jgi:general secretion pathway protein F/type IV pilus assembly protein PilC